MRRNLYLGLLAVVCIQAWAQTKRVDDRALRNAGKNADEWLTYGRDYAATHYSPLKQIDTTNVKRLGLAWSWDTESPAGRTRRGDPFGARALYPEQSALHVRFGRQGTDSYPSAVLVLA